MLLLLLVVSSEMTILIWSAESSSRVGGERIELSWLLLPFAVVGLMCYARRSKQFSRAAIAVRCDREQAIEAAAEVRMRKVGELL